jgi:hypothetical protein
MSLKCHNSRLAIRRHVAILLDLGLGGAYLAARNIQFLKESRAVNRN